MENLQLTTLVDNIPSLCLAEVDTVLTAAASLESEAVGRGLSVTIDGANSAASNTSRLNGHIPVHRKPLDALATVAVFSYASQNNEATS